MDLSISYNNSIIVGRGYIPEYSEVRRRPRQVKKRSKLIVRIYRLMFFN